MKRLLLITTLLVVGIQYQCSAQMSKFKALFVFNFAQNTGWSEELTTNKNFVITVIGDNDVANELKTLAGSRKIGNSKMVIKEASTVDNIGQSHIIYLSQNRSSQMPVLTSYQKNNKVLIIGNQQGICSQGAGITFIIDDGKLKFEISPDNIEKQGLIISKKMIALGVQVN